jgi:two-component system, NarL family, nitrate/nitrite response regulator NarL
VTEALALGAVGYMLKSITPQSLLQTMRLVMAGESYIAPHLAARLVQMAAENARRANNERRARAVLDRLTMREQQILDHLTTGKTNKEIARTLDLTEKTVKHYMGKVLQKLSARNRTEAVILSRSFRGDGGAAPLAGRDAPASTAA